MIGILTKAKLFSENNILQTKSKREIKKNCSEFHIKRNFSLCTERAATVIFVIISIIRKTFN